MQAYQHYKEWIVAPPERIVLVTHWVDYLGDEPSSDVRESTLTFMRKFTAHTKRLTVLHVAPTPLRDHQERLGVPGGEFGCETIMHTARDGGSLPARVSGRASARL